MECLKAVDFERYDSGSLSPTERHRVEVHLDQCPGCRTAHQRYRSNEAFLAAARPAMKETSQGNSVPPAATDEPDQRAHYPHIQGYEIIGVAGRGGMGIVYEAIQTALDRKVALKVLPAILGTASPDAVARFRREAAAAAKLHHTNIIPIYDSGQSPDGYYYSMELIDGEPLNRVIGKLATVDITEASAVRIAEILVGSAHVEHTQNNAGAMTECSADMPPDDSTTKDTPAEPSSSSMRRGRIYFQHVARWMADVADALDYAHRQGIIHRDIKPSNLILSRDGRLMIADFGLAHASGEKSLTMTGSLVGTLRYMSPEQAMAKRLRLDHRTDIYSLGVTMYELLTFQPAFHGRDEKEILSQVITRDPTAPRKLNPSVPRELDTICLKCVDKSPAARYDTAKHLADDLRRYVDDLPIVARRPGLLGKTVKFLRRHSTEVRTAGIILVVIAILLGGNEGFRWHRGNSHYKRAVHLIVAGEHNAAAENLLRAYELGNKRAKSALADSIEIGLLSVPALLRAGGFKHALDIHPDDVDVLVTWAISKINYFNSLTGSPDQTILHEANALCQRALELEPDNIWGLNVHGVILKKLGRYDEATAAYTEVTLLRPDWYAPLVNLGTIYALKRDLQKADRYLRKSAALALEHVNEPQAADAWRNLASLQLHLGKIGEARGNIQLALKCKHDDMDSLLIQARLLLDLDPGAAVESAVNANYLAEGREPKVHRILSLAYLRTDRFDNAIASARKAIDGGDMPTINHLILAIASARLDDLPSARAHFDQAQATWPDDLKDEGAFRTTAPKGVLWFESAAELTGLRHEAEALIYSLPSGP